MSGKISIDCLFVLDVEGSCEAVIVTGETGCGKTTQMPQYILESQPNAKILVCQPRRLAATGVALRVAEEQGYDLNNQGK